MTAETVSALPVSSVPAAYDRGHLYSPKAETVAYGIDYRPGDLFEPMPSSDRSDPKQWGEWWRSIAKTETPDFLGLVPGDEITIQHPCSVEPGTVLSTCRFGAVVRYPMPDGASEPFAEMYVTHRNHLGHWYR